MTTNDVEIDPLFGGDVVEDPHGYYRRLPWGIHLCVGAPLARMEAKTAIEALLARTTEISDLEAFGILSVIIAAGGESTTSLIGTAARILAEHPDVQDRLRRDPALVPAFIEEALRYDPTAGRGRRRARAG